MARTLLESDRLDYWVARPTIKDLMLNTGSNSGAAKILCIEPNVAVVESRCAVLKTSGYDAASASPQVAGIVLRRQKFDLVVVSALEESDLQAITLSPMARTCSSSMRLRYHRNCSLWLHSD
jgi:hypothetical protein